MLLCSACNFPARENTHTITLAELSHTLLTVLLVFSPTPTHPPGSTSEAARIIYPPASRSIMATKGQRLVLECVASGIPTPQVRWAKDGQDLRSVNNTRFLLSNLLIDAVGEGDSGTYACQADNGILSSASAMVLYNVQVSGESTGGVRWRKVEELHHLLQ